MGLLDFLMKLHLPMSTERPCTKPSRSEVKRWIKKQSVIINGKVAEMGEIAFPVSSLVFFPKGRRKCSMV